MSEHDWEGHEFYWSDAFQTYVEVMEFVQKRHIFVLIMNASPSADPLICKYSKKQGITTETSEMGRFVLFMKH